jgi:hypothetical protein
MSIANCRLPIFRETEVTSLRSPRNLPNKKSSIDNRQLAILRNLMIDNWQKLLLLEFLGMGAAISKSPMLF